MKVARILFVRLVLASAPRLANAQAMGSTMAFGNADTLFRAFVAHLEQKGYSVQYSDPPQRLVRFVATAVPEETRWNDLTTGRYNNA